MAISEDTYDAFMFENLKSSITARENEKQRNTQTLNGILETALAGNISHMQTASAGNVKNLQTMGIGEATAISNVIRSDLTPQVVSVGAAVRAFADAVRAAQPPTTGS